MQLSVRQNNININTESNKANNRKDHSTDHYCPPDSSATKAPKQFSVQHELSQCEFFSNFDDVCITKYVEGNFNNSKTLGAVIDEFSKEFHNDLMS